MERADGAPPVVPPHPGRDAVTPDVMVVGGGPAGSVTALLLARRGLRVRLVDRARFPRTKACGECVNPGAVAHLRDLGLDPRTLDVEPALLRGWSLSTRHGTLRQAPFPNDAGVGWGIERAELDAALLRAAATAGVDVCEGVYVEGVSTRSGLPAVETRSGPMSARLVVGADGLRSRVARSVGWVSRGGARPKVSQTLRIEGVDLERGAGRLLLDRHETIGLAPVGRTGWNLTRVVPAGAGAQLARTPLDLIGLATTGIPEVGRARATGSIRSSGPFDWRCARISADGIALVGDAGGYFDPLTGQGIQRALAGARSLAASAAKALADRRVPRGIDLDTYTRAMRHQVGPTRRVQRLIEWLLQHPALLDRSLARLDHAGTLPDLVAVTGDARPVRSLLTVRHLRRGPAHREAGWMP